MNSIQRYVSKELTHFVGKGKTEEEQFNLLIKILKSGWLTHPPHNPKISGNLTVELDGQFSEGDMYIPQVVCFSDIPIQDLEIHINNYSKFGLSFLKSYLIKRGANPVYYIAKNSTLNSSNDTTVPRADYFDIMMRHYKKVFNDLKIEKNLLEIQKIMKLERFLDFYVFSYIKPFDDLKDDYDPENYYMEREWRINGNLNFKLEDVHRIFLPKSFAKRFRSDISKYVGQISYVE